MYRNENVPTSVISDEVACASVLRQVQFSLHVFEHAPDETHTKNILTVVLEDEIFFYKKMKAHYFLNCFPARKYLPQQKQ